MKTRPLPRTLAIRVLDVVVALQSLDEDLQDLRPREEEALGAELVKMWRAVMHGESADYPETTIALAGLVKRVAEEYNLPGDFS